MGGGGGRVGRKRKWEDEMEGVARGMKNNSQFFPPRGLNIKSGRLSKGVPVFVFLTPWVNGGGGGAGWEEEEMGG